MFINSFVFSTPLVFLSFSAFSRMLLLSMWTILSFWSGVCRGIQILRPLWISVTLRRRAEPVCPSSLVCSTRVGLCSTTLSSVSRARGNISPFEFLYKLIESGRRVGYMFEDFVRLYEAACVVNMIQFSGLRITPAFQPLNDCVGNFLPN